MTFPPDLFSPERSSGLPSIIPTEATSSEHKRSVLATLTPLIDATINRLNLKRFLPDPIAGEHFSRIVSIMSSAYKRHGHIIERAILEQLKACPDLQVWNDAEFHVSANADLLANGSLANPASIIGNETNYGEGTRSVQVDAIVYDRRTKTLRAYEVIHTIDELHDLECGFRSLTEAIDTTTVGGRLVFHIFGALAEFERGIIRERTIAGLAAAKARGRTGGRPRVMTPQTLAAAKALLETGELTIREVAKQLGISEATIYKHIPQPRLLSC